MRDDYGFQPSTVDQWHARVHGDAAADAASEERSTPAPLEAQNDQPTPQSHPELFIAIHEPEVVALTGNDRGIHVTTGRILTRYRLRGPEDEGLDHITLPPNFPEPPAVPVIHGDDWRTTEYGMSLIPREARQWNAMRRASDTSDNTPGLGSQYRHNRRNQFGG